MSALEDLFFLGGEPFKFFFQNYTIDGVINDAEKEFEVVKQAFLQKLAKLEEPQDVIRKRTYGTLELIDLFASMYRLEYQYN